MSRVLMIAFHYPPFRGSSSVQRTLKFSRYLPDHGWEPIVLTARPRAYAQAGDDQMQEIPKDVVVERSLALDAARHFAIRGRYPGWMALPDRWATWCLSAVPAGLRMIREYAPDVLWSTYPIASAHLIGLMLRRMSGIPWVADFRDPMTEAHYPPQRMLRSVRRWIEQATVRHCDRAVFTAPGSVRKYAQRYPDEPPGRWTLIRNGYDEENFARAEQLRTDRPTAAGRLVLVHSGLLYRSERDPRAFFDAIGELRRSGKLTARGLRIVLRASGDVDYHLRHLRERGIEDIVKLEPALPYEPALAEMLSADGLLLFQAANCNQQIPAKAYEYIRAKRPILALTDPKGDTADLLRTAGVGTIVPLDSQPRIASSLLEFVKTLRRRTAPVVADAATIESHSRASRAHELAVVFDAVSGK